eukprot:520379-Pyramimonas_sp.AAC.1
MAPKKPRYDDADSLKTVLAPFVKNINWLSYPNKPTHGYKKSKLTANRALLYELQSLTPNLSFKPAAVKHALSKIAKAKGFDLSSDEVLDWIEEHDKRLRCLCAHARELKGTF